MNTKPVLRPLRVSDLEAFLTWAGDPEVTQGLFWDPYADREKALQFLETVVEPHPWLMAICVDGAPVGAVSLDVGKARARVRAELGYVMAKKHWGKGYATEAVKLALIRGFEDLDIKRIEAFVDPENIGSIRVLEKGGLQQEALFKKYVVHRGQIRDRYVFSKTI